MAGPGDDSERPHEATPEKLKKARERGEAPQSKELVSTAAFCVIISSLAFAGSELAGSIGKGLRPFLSTPTAFRDPSAVMDAIANAVWMPILLLLVLPIAGALLAAAIQRNLFFAPNRLAPKWARLSPLSNAKQRFGPAGFVEFTKTIAKAVLFCGVLVATVGDGVYRLAGLPRFGENSMLVHAAQFAELIFIAGAGVAVPVAGLDYLWQRHEHARKQRMSRKELRDEAKDMEGDPNFKSRRRERSIALATAGMLRDVAKADVVVTNPTHYAVALHWDSEKHTAPVCAAKGTDYLAAAIRDHALDHGVPVRQDAPLARAIYATVEVGEVIRTEHYAAVAAALRFAQTMRQRGGKVGRRE